MPTYQLLTDRTLAQSSAITPTTLIHIVYTGDPSQNPAGSSYKAELGQLVGLFSGASDTLVTGGTYSAGTITFTNNSGGTFNVSGLTEPFTGGTVSGATIFTGGLSANTFSATTYLNLPISGTHDYLSKFSSGSTILVDSQLRDNGSTVGLGIAPNVNAKLFVLTSSQSYGLAGQNQNTNGIGVFGQALALGNTTGVVGIANGTSTSNIGVYGQANEATTNIGLKGFAFNGTNNYSAQLQDGTEGIGKVLTSVTSDGKANWQTLPSSTFTGGTVSGATNFTNGLTANTFSASSIFVNGVQITGDTFVTGGTFFIDTITFTNNQGNNFQVTGITASGTTFTGGSGNCIADLYVSNIHSCSPLNINPLNEGNVYFGSTSGVTIDVINSRIGIGTQSPSESLDVSGKIKTINFQMSSGATNGYVLTSDASGNASWQTPTGGSLTFTGGSVSGATIFTGGLSANTMSATTYLNLPAGVFGISDSSGVYSYYSTLQSAINSANSGDTIQMFSNVLETSATTVNLKNGVNINMNGYTYTLSQTSSDQCLSDNNVIVNCKIYNGNINRSGSTYVNDITSLCLYIRNSNSVIETNGVYFNTTSTTGINNAGTLKGAIVNSYARGIVNSGKLYSVNATATLETGIYCNATTSEVYDSIGRSLSSGYGIGMLIPSFNGVLSNSIGYAVALSGIYAANVNRMQSCIGYSSGNPGIEINASVVQDCKGYSSAGIGVTLTNVLSGINILGYSFSSIGAVVSVPTNGIVSVIENLTAESLSNFGATLNATGTGILIVKNLQANSQLSGGLGYPCKVSGNNNISILGGSLTSYNSAECINAPTPITLKYANLTLKTSASPAVNSNITQGITFSADSQGNIVTT